MNFACFANDVLDDAYERDGERRIKRQYRPRINFDRILHEVPQRFRLGNGELQYLIDILSPYLAHGSDANAALSVDQQIQLSLRYLATGDNYRTIADSHGVHKSTLSRTLHRFVTAVNNHIYPLHVDWPQEPERNRAIAEEFYEKAGMPAVFGCVDGIHCKIVAPPGELIEPQFVNRFGTHSINAMLVCGPKLRFYYALTRWPGSVHDARVFRASSLRTRLDGGWRPFPFGVLLGDSAYANADYLIGPVLNPRTEQEREYNAAHKRTRRLIECAIGLLKQRFRCLLHVMHLAPEFAAEVILCCVALHNLLLPDDVATAELQEFDRERVADPNLDHEATSSESDNTGDQTRRAQIIATF